MEIYLLYSDRGICCCWCPVITRIVRNANRYEFRWVRDTGCRCFDNRLKMGELRGLTNWVYDVAVLIKPKRRKNACYFFITNFIKAKGTRNLSLRRFETFTFKNNFVKKIAILSIAGDTEKKVFVLHYLFFLWITFSLFGEESIRKGLDLQKS